MLAAGFSFLINAIFAALVLGAAIPGPQRAVCPGCYGLSDIAPGVWTDAPGERARLLALRTEAETSVADFFGTPPPRLTTILCTTRGCAKAFGIGGNGLSVPRLAILVSPGGLTPGTLSHELTHAHLHRTRTLSDILRPPFPTWFDEGLATNVANHPRWSGAVSQTDRARVRATRHFWQWDDTMRALGPGPAYRAAADEVAGLEARLGHAGLLDLIRRAEAGEDFDALLSR